MTVIALDAMGGDFAPRAPVQAALRFVEREKVEVILVGDEARLKEELFRHGRKRGHGKGLGGGSVQAENVKRVRIHHTPDFVEMDEAPVEALRRKPLASVRAAFELVKAGEAAGVVSAGHSGAMMIAGKMVLDTLPGVDRPAIATHLPRKRGRAILLDSGANVDCKPQYLLQFAVMGAVFARVVMELAEPRIALLSNGSEAGKGNALTRQAYKLPENSGLHFAGNLEPRDLFREKADVIVCDGFVGNLVLKMAEAASSEIRLLVKESAFRGPLARLGYWVLRGFFLDLARRSDYREIGGSLLLGLRGVAIVGHGASNARTIYNALGLAAQCAEGCLIDVLEAELNRVFGQKTFSA